MAWTKMQMLHECKSLYQRFYFQASIVMTVWYADLVWNHRKLSIITGLFGREVGWVEALQLEEHDVIAVD